MESDWKDWLESGPNEWSNNPTIKSSGYNARRVRLLINYILGLKDLGLEIPDHVITCIDYLEHEIKFNSK